MLLRNPDLSVVIEDLRAASEERSRELARWIMILIAEASVTSLLLVVICVRWLLIYRRRPALGYSSIPAKPTGEESSQSEKESLVSEDSAWAH